MVTESRNVDAGDLAGLEDSKSLGDFDRITINEDFDGVIRVGKMNPSSGEWGSRREIWFGWGLSCSSLGFVEFRCGGDRAD